MFLDSSSTFDEAVTYVTDHIHFYEDSILPSKTICHYQNNKPWIMEALRNTLDEKKRAYMAHDIVEVKRVQVRLRKEIKEAKSLYKEEVEKQFRNGNLNEAWIEIKTLTEQNTTQEKNVRKVPMPFLDVSLLGFFKQFLFTNLSICLYYCC